MRTRLSTLLDSLRLTGVRLNLGPFALNFDLAGGSGSGHRLVSHGCRLPTRFRRGTLTVARSGTSAEALESDVLQSGWQLFHHTMAGSYWAILSRVGLMKNELSRPVKLEKDGSPEYLEQAKLWTERLQGTWERVIEERLFNGVVLRFDPAIHTQQLEDMKERFTCELA